MVKEIFEFASDDEVACMQIIGKCDEGYKIANYDVSKNMKRCKIVLVANKEVILGGVN